MVKQEAQRKSASALPELLEAGNEAKHAEIDARELENVASRGSCRGPAAACASATLRPARFSRAIDENAPHLR
jgi:hypothetical protein